MCELEAAVVAWYDSTQSCGLLRWPQQNAALTIAVTCCSMVTLTFDIEQACSLCVMFARQFSKPIYSTQDLLTGLLRIQLTQ